MKKLDRVSSDFQYLDGATVIARRSRVAGGTELGNLLPLIGCSDSQ